MRSLLRFLFGERKNPTDPRVLHQLTLIAFFAWVGLGADGLSSSCYGPEEAFEAMGVHRHLVWPLAALVAVTVFSITASYSQVVDLFPGGGGGYLVATKLLGRGAGVLSGVSLIVDYVLTVAISCAAGVKALLSISPGLIPEYWLLPSVLAAVLLLISINLRGVKESIKVLLPVFLMFVITHLVLILWGWFGQPGLFVADVKASVQEIRSDVALSGILPLLWILTKAFALGGGTFTGIEAVSNSMQILREPKVQTARRTMLYMAISLAFTAAGLLIAYHLYGVHKDPNLSLNAQLFRKIAGTSGAGGALVTVALLAEAGLLFVAAQAGFIGGPRTLATMAVDGWVPRPFARLSDRLVIQNGVLVMGGLALFFVLVTRGVVENLVVLYSISVFITFVLTQAGLLWHWVREKAAPARLAKIALNAWGLLLTMTILVTSVIIKLPEGAWISLLVIAALIFLAITIQRHYRRIGGLLATLDQQMAAVDPGPPPSSPRELDSSAPTAILLASGYNGLGLHALLTVYRMFPGQFKNVIFVSVGVVDYDRLRGEKEIEDLRRGTEEALKKYVSFAQRAGFAAGYRMAMGTDPVDEVVEICRKIAQDYNQCVAFGGQLAFKDESIWTRMLHSQVAFEIQRRLQFAGLPLVILPVRAVART